MMVRQQKSLNFIDMSSSSNDLGWKSEFTELVIAFRSKKAIPPPLPDVLGNSTTVKSFKLYKTSVIELLFTFFEVHVSVKANRSSLFD